MTLSLVCKECNTEFEAYPSQNRKFCSDKCRLNVLHRETPQKRMTGEYRLCRVCGEEFYVPLHKIREGKGICCSHDCRHELRSRVFKRFPELNPFFVDGRTPESAKWYKSRKWVKVRNAVYKRDNYKCKICKSKKSIVVHHIIPRKECDKPYDKANLVTLCHRCHFKTHHRR